MKDKRARPEGRRLEMGAALAKLPGARWLGRHFAGGTLSGFDIWAIFFPVLISQGLLVIMSLIKPAMISRHGAEALGAVGMMEIVYVLASCAYGAFAQGGTLVIALYKGAREKERMSDVFAGAAQLLLLLSMALLLAGLAFKGPILSYVLQGAVGGIRKDSEILLVSFALSFPGGALVELCCGAFSACGKMSKSLLLTLGMNLLYLASGGILINACGLGVWGMAAAQVLSRSLAAVAAFYIMRRKNDEFEFRFGMLGRFYAGIYGKVMKLAAPLAVENTLLTAGRLVCQTCLAALGTDAMAANTIINSLNVIGMFHNDAFAISIVTIVGRCMGNRDAKQIKQVTSSFLVAIAAATVATEALALCLYRPLMERFVAPPGMEKTILASLLVIFAGQALLWGNAFVLPAMLRACGDAKFVLCAAMITVWLVRVPLSFLLTERYGVIGINLAITADWVLRVAIYRIRHRSGRWMAGIAHG
jgi:Na+-driven multidrug efflux pump